jgi:hypothetical protein
MVIDFSTALAPFLWGMVGLLLILAGAIVASIDPEGAEIYLGDRRLLVGTAVLALLALAALLAAHPAVVNGLAMPYP